MARDGGGGSSASWRFDDLVAGTYEVLVTYPAHESRASNAPYNIYDDGVLLTMDPVMVNQKFTPEELLGAAPGEIEFAGNTWFGLGTYQVSGVLRVKLRNAADGVVAADAVRLIRIEPRSEAR